MNVEMKTYNRLNTPPRKPILDGVSVAGNNSWKNTPWKKGSGEKTLVKKNTGTKSSGKKSIPFQIYCKREHSEAFHAERNNCIKILCLTEAKANERAGQRGEKPQRKIASELIEV